MSNRLDKEGESDLGAVGRSNSLPKHGDMVSITKSDKEECIGFVGKLCLKWETLSYVLDEMIDPEIDYPCFAVIGEKISYINGRDSFMEVEYYCA